MKILVTGGSGFIGSHVVRHYQGRAEIVVLDNLRTGERGHLDGLACRFVEGSILDRDLVDELMTGTDFVFHLAALVSVPESVASPFETVEINVRGLLNVLESARQHRAKKLVFASSAAVYGENPTDPKSETLPPDPRSPYAVTKLDGEYYCALYAREGWLPTAALRFFNVFGPGQNPLSAYAAAVPIFLQRARAGEPLVVHGDGGQTRDFIYVQDIVEALALAAEKPSPQGSFNAGCGQAISILELAREIVRLTGSSSSIEFGPLRPGDLRHSTADPRKLFAEGWRPRFDISVGLKMLTAAITK
ncbi:MAG: NAD-dependent epimerase/dehydratase family protein [Akkermansiaceae bacterium]